MTIVTLYSDAPVYGGGERYLELLATGFDRRELRRGAHATTFRGWKIGGEARPNFIAR